MSCANIDNAALADQLKHFLNGPNKEANLSSAKSPRLAEFVLQMVLKGLENKKFSNKFNNIINNNTNNNNNDNNNSN